MAVRLFNLRGVPDDEANEVRELLAANGIDSYETPAGNWGISMPAIWLKDRRELPRAQALIASYQASRQVRVREQYERLKRERKHRTLLDVIRDDPLRFVLYVVLIAVIVYLSTMPFWGLGR